MSTFAITGASRGIGLELISQLLDLPSTKVSHIYALSRGAPAPQSDLQKLLSQHPGRVTHIICAVDSTDSVERAAAEVEKRCERRGLDVLVNNAGVGGSSPNLKLDGYTPETMTQYLDTNVTGPHRMIRAFLPLLRRGREAKIINVSSSLGSISLAEHFSAVPTQAYKVSKAALDMLSKQYALDLAGEGFTVLAVSPGHLKTDLGGDGDFDVSVGTAELKRIILEATPEVNGKFVNIHVPGWEDAFGKYDGKEIPW